MDKEDQIARIADYVSKSEISEIINTFFRILDEKNFDNEHLETIFASDIKIMRPNGTSLVGIEAIRESYQASFARFKRTQHLLSGHDTRIEGDIATVRVNLVAMHLWNGSNNDANKAENFFIAGAVIDSKLHRIESKWKIRFIDNTNVWRAGTGFKNMEQTDK